MPDPTDTPPSAKPPSSAGGDTKASRRRLLRGALATAPVLMTLVSRPVLAQRICTTPSGFVSINASHPGAAQCSGNGPQYWATHTGPGQWPTGYKPDEPHATRFNDAFGNVNYFTGNPTLLSVLGFTGSDKNDVARYCSAALLNAAQGLTSQVLSPSAVIGIWKEFASTNYGTFSPSSGASWKANEIVSYLSSTMTSS